jgi:hypothetical protein
LGRSVSRPLLTGFVVVVAVATWVVAGYRIMRVGSVDLAKAERSVFSPAGQDGVLERIFQVIEPAHRFVVDLGAGDGVAGSCSRNLIVNHGWRGLLIEPATDAGAALAENYAEHEGVRTLPAGVFPGDVEILLERADVPRDFDLLIVALQSNDWYVWRAIRDFRPKVVQINYNAAFVPPQTMVIEYHPLNYWDGSIYFGASIQSLFDLGQSKGYELVYADRSGTTLYFVERRYFGRFGVADNRPVRLFVPRDGFPLITPSLVFSYMGPDGRPLRQEDAELVHRNLLVERHFVVGEL